MLVLATATTYPQVGRSAVLATAYGGGLGLPFVLIAAGLDRAGRASRWLRRHQRTIRVGGGVMLVLVGLLLLTGIWEDLNRWLQTGLVSGFLSRCERSSRGRARVPHEPAITVPIMPRSSWSRMWQR